MENLILDFSGDTLTAVLMGDMDHHGVAGVRTQIDDAMFRLMPKILCIELSGVEFMDSSGLGLILGRYQKASDLGIEVMLSNPRDDRHRQNDKNKRKGGINREKNAYKRDKMQFSFAFAE